MSDSAPSNLEYLYASVGVYQQSLLVNLPGLTPLVGDPIGGPLSGETDLSELENPSQGLYAQAYEDSAGNIIVSFEGTDSNNLPGSDSADQLILKDQPLQAFEDALKFVRQVQADYSMPVYLTGQSLGGAEAEYVASQDPNIIGGATFGAPGLPLNPATDQNSSLVDYIDPNDPVGNFGSDSYSKLHWILGDLNEEQAHYGDAEVVNPNAASPAAFAYNTAILIEDGIVTFAQLNASLIESIPSHQLSNYAADLGYSPAIVQTITALEQESGPYSYPDLTLEIANQAIAAADSNLSTPASGPLIGPPTSSTSIPTGYVYSLASLFPATEEPSDTSNSIQTYSLTIVLGSGFATINNQTYTVGSVITNINQAEFDAGYFYAGTTPGEDELTACAFDNMGNSSNEADVTITVSSPAAPAQPINQSDDTPPTILPPSSVPGVDVGGSVVLSNSYLDVTDTNSSNYAPSQFTYVIVSNPAYGYLLEGGSFVTSFTQQDVDNNLISYEEVSGATSADSFSYYVEDPNGDQTPISTFNIAINHPPSTTNPVLTTDVPLDVGQDQTALITDNNLYVTDPGVQSWQLIYHITSGPTNGVIVAGGPQPYFSQQEVDQGLVSYQNNGVTSGTDGFDFTVSDTQGGTIGASTFDIDVIPKNNLAVQPERPLYTDLFGLSDGIPTGTDAPAYAALIDPDVLTSTDPGVDPSDIIYTVQNLAPDAMDIQVGTWEPPNGNNAQFNAIREIVANPGGGFETGGIFGDYFTQAELNAGEVWYNQGNSGALGDQFSLGLSVSDNAENTVSNVVLPVVLQNSSGLLSDGIFVPHTQNPAPSMIAAIGQTTVIGSGLFTWISPQFSDDQIEYSIEYLPSAGVLLLDGAPIPSNPSTHYNLSNFTFTQQDVDEG